MFQDGPPGLAFCVPKRPIVCIRSGVSVFRARVDENSRRRICFGITGNRVDRSRSENMKININKSLRAKNLGRPRITRNGQVVIAGVCLHDTAGSGKHGDTLYLANPGDGRAVSVDFTVERDGSIYQLNPDLQKYYTFHAGRATRFRAADGSTYKNRDVTRVLIGIELVQKANLSLSPIWPADQIQAAAELCLFLAQTFGFGKSQITTHQQIITDGSRSDPRQFPFDSFWFYFNRAANVPAIDPPAGELGRPVIHTVKAGETLYSISKMYAVTVETIKARNDIVDPSNLIRVGQVLLIRR